MFGLCRDPLPGAQVGPHDPFAVVLVRPLEGSVEVLERRVRTSITEANRSSFDPKSCITWDATTPASAAMPRIVVLAKPSLANLARQPPARLAGCCGCRGADRGKFRERDLAGSRERTYRATFVLNTR